MESDLIGKARVLVRTPCNCGKPWFLCDCADSVAEYEVQTYDTVLDAHQLKYIEAQHPGMTLIY